MSLHPFLCTVSGCQPSPPGTPRPWELLKWASRVLYTRLSAVATTGRLAPLPLRSCPCSSASPAHAPAWKPLSLAASPGRTAGLLPGGGRSWGLPDPPSLRVQMLFVSPDPTAAWLECSLHQRPPARDITVKFSVMEQWLWVKQVRVCSLFLPLTDL